MVTELEELMEAQRADDTHTITPEFRDQVPLTEGIANRIGMEPDGEIVSYEARPPRGTLLVGTASWHGTYGGYTRRACRCEPCTKANSDYRRQRRENGAS